MTTPPLDRPRRCLIFGPRRLSHLLWHRGVLASLVASGRQILVATHGEPPKADHGGVLEPTLMRWRLENTPEHLDVPLCLGRDDVDLKIETGLERPQRLLRRERFGIENADLLRQLQG